MLRQRHLPSPSGSAEAGGLPRLLLFLLPREMKRTGEKHEAKKIPQKHNTRLLSEVDTLKLQGFSQLELVSLQLATKIDPPKNTLLLWMRKLKTPAPF